MSGTLLCGRTFLQSKPWLKAAPSGKTLKEGKKTEKRESATVIHALITPVFFPHLVEFGRNTADQNQAAAPGLKRFGPCVAPVAGHFARLPGQLFFTPSKSYA